MDKLRSIYASANSASITIAVIVAVTIGAELSSGFKDWLAGFTGHHWVTKSWLSIIIFVLLYLVFRALNKNVSINKTEKALFILQIASVIGFFLILWYYIYHFFTA